MNGAAGTSPKPAARPFIIAEVGSVHDGSFGNALRLVDVAAECGASAIKFQLHIPEEETTKYAPAPRHFASEDRFTYFARTSFTPAQWTKLKSHAEGNGIIFLASIFSLGALRILEDLDVQAHKIPSGEVTNLPLLEAVAATGKRVYLSSGMSNWNELDAAVDFLSSSELTVMQCSSVYPCPPELIGLNVLTEMMDRYSGHSVGFSDHSEGSVAAIAAVSLGSSAVEKHLTFSRMMYGSDAPFGLEPAEFSRFVSDLQLAERMRSTRLDKDDLSPYIDTRAVFQKSIVAARPIRKDAEIRHDDIGFKKPGTGLPPSEIERVIGKTSRRDISVDEQISLSDVE